MIHVYPVDDLMEHDTTNTGSTCRCEPEIMVENGEIIVIHNSFDGREGMEWLDEILNNQP